MSVKDHLNKNLELKRLVDLIYESESEILPLAYIKEFIEVIISMADSNEVDKVEAGYIITDVLLKYDENDVYEKVYDLSCDLEIADAKDNYWNKRKVRNVWNDLKSTFQDINLAFQTTA